MTKILNLDKIETKRDKVIILGGVEHVMATLTVRDYLNQMKTQSQIEKLAAKADEAASLEEIMEITIEALSRLFPTVTKEQFEALSFEQITAIRELAEDTLDSEVTEDTPGETPGETE